MPGYVPTQSLVFLVTNRDGYIRYKGVDITPEAVYATFLDGAFRPFIFKHRHTDGLNVRPVQELTDRLNEETRSDNTRERAIQRIGLISRSELLHQGVPIYQDVETGQIGGVFWTPEEMLRVLDEEGLQYTVLKRVEGHSPVLRQLTREETERKMLEDLARGSIKEE